MASRIVVYLAGYIQHDVIDQCRAWRQKVMDYYRDWKGTGKPYPISWLDPMNGEEGTVLDKHGFHSSVTAHAVIHRDYTSVLKADLVVANLDTFGCTRAPIGTISEIAWAWDHRKPIIVISGEPTYSEHPFISYFSSWTVKSVDELLEKKIINFFFKGWVDARK